MFTEVAVARFPEMYPALHLQPPAPWGADRSRSLAHFNLNFSPVALFDP